MLGAFIQQVFHCHASAALLGMAAPVLNGGDAELNAVSMFGSSLLLLGKLGILATGLPVPHGPTGVRVLRGEMELP